MRIYAQRAFLDSGWSANVAIAVSDGKIAAIEPLAERQSGDISVDTLLPALSNLHSHSFQRAMAGMTEFRQKGRESFWTWRALMYRYLDRMTPEHIEAIAELAFLEMLEAGYAAVGEFHYLHHAPGGTPYSEIAELSHRVLAAAHHTGIGITLLPVLYSQGGMDGRPLEGGQRRFGNSVDSYIKLVEHCRTRKGEMHPDTQVGIAPHSLRACAAHDLQSVVQSTPRGPIHIHIAEQTREVEEAQNTMGARPVEWLLANAEVSERWCLIHATHMTGAETHGIANSGAVAGLCPVTEANLGDGVFPAAAFLEAGGTFGIGTDSNVNISVCEELRTLEYGQRLVRQERNVLAIGAASTGQALYLGAVAGGAKALARTTGRIAVGKLADLVAIDSAHPALCMLNENQLFDGLAFAANDCIVRDVWSAGRHQVRDGRHIDRDAVLGRSFDVLRDLTCD